ncbi:MAG TPA: CsbD family protein [Pyrinomonadaceae bacterium]|nr:CsbD family protein [Pyrinomonadaceae bacterium]
MGLPNKDEMEGKFDQAKGAVKENVGRAMDDREMESEGAADRASGNIQEGYGTAKRKVGDAIKDVGDEIRK